MAISTESIRSLDTKYQAMCVSIYSQLWSGPGWEKSVKLTGYLAPTCKKGNSPFIYYHVFVYFSSVINRHSSAF